MHYQLSYLLLKGLLATVEQPSLGWRRSPSDVPGQHSDDEHFRSRGWDLLICPSPRLSPRLTMRWFPIGNSADSYQKLTCFFGEPGNVVELTISSFVPEARQVYQIKYRPGQESVQFRSYGERSSLADLTGPFHEDSNLEVRLVDRTTMMLPPLLLDRVRS